MESFFRQQGMDGTSYRVATGDVIEQRKSRADAQSRPMPLSHDILPRVFPWIQSMTQKHGKIHFGWIGPYAQVTIADPRVIRDVFYDKPGHIKKNNRNSLLKLLINGIVHHDGSKWAKHRKIINPAFHIEKLKLMGPAFAMSCTELMSRWEKMVATEGSCELDVCPEFHSFTGDVISRTAFGSSYEEGSRIFRLQLEQASNFIQNFWGSIVPGYSFLPTQKNLRMRAIDREVKDLIRGIIAKREKSLNLGDAKKDDLLGLLLDSSRSEGKLAMTAEDVVEECRLFYYSGQETTANLLTWTMVVLSMHQTWQERAREEVTRVFGSEKPKIEDLGQMKVVTMILLEVLRLYSPAPVVLRTVETATMVGNFRVPAGVDLVLPISLVHHDPEVWGDDVHEFKPERFSGGVSNAYKGQAGYFPFGWGHRVCIGPNFSMVEVKLFLAMALRQFRFELSPSYRHAPHTVLTLQPQHGVPIIVHKL